MKKAFFAVAAMAAVSAFAVDIAVTPLQINALKDGKVEGSTVTGASAPGCSIDFPHSGPVDGTGITQAKLVVENVGGVELLPTDFVLNLRKDNKDQIEVFGAPGRNPGEIYFMLDETPEQINLIRLYLDKQRRFLDKEMKFKFKSLSLDKAEGMFPEMHNVRIGNCKVEGKFPTFTVTPQNTGSSIIFYPAKKQLKNKFTKIEIGLTMLKGSIDPAATEMNPRVDNKTQVSTYNPQVEGNKYTFTLKETFENASIIVFYFNRHDKLTNKEISFRIDYLCLIP